MDSEGNVKEFGRDAFKKYTRLPKPDHLFFHDIKMILQHDEVVYMYLLVGPRL